MFKIGETVKCINSRASGYKLKEGKLYKVIDSFIGYTGKNIITVKDDNNDDINFYGDRFELSNQIKEEW